MRLGPYEVVGELGRGGAGVVYRARDAAGRAVAIKVLSAHAAGAPGAVAREERMQAALGEEDGFVPLLDSGSSPQGPYLVMPLVPGGTLRDRLRAGRLGVEETVALGVALARALAAAHERGIVHRDLKPENVLFTHHRGADSSGGRPLIADLGLAKYFEGAAASGAESAALTRSGVFKGTSGYMAPEQMRDAKSAGPPADVFSLGAILFECLAGEPAFVGESPLELFTRVERGEHGDLAKARPDAPAWLVQTVHAFLAHDAPARPAGGRGALERLEARRPDARRSPWTVALAVALSGLLVAGVAAAVASIRHTPKSLDPGAAVAPVPSPGPTGRHVEGPRTPPAPDAPSVEKAVRLFERAEREAQNVSVLTRDLQSVQRTARSLLDAVATVRSANAPIDPGRIRKVLAAARDGMSLLALNRSHEGLADFIRMLEVDEERTPEGRLEAVRYLAVFEEEPTAYPHLLAEGDALAADPDAPPRVRAEGFAGAGRALIHLGRLEEAESRFVRGELSCPGEAPLLRAHARFLMKRGRGDEAFALTTPYIDQLPPEEAGLLRESRCEILLARGEPKRALEELAAIRREAGTRGAVMILKAMAHGALGEKDMAKVELLRAKRRAGESASTEDARRVEEVARDLGIVLE